MGETMQTTGYLFLMRIICFLSDFRKKNTIVKNKSYRDLSFYAAAFAFRCLRFGCRLEER